MTLESDDEIRSAANIGAFAERLVRRPIPGPQDAASRNVAISPLRMAWRPATPPRRKSRGSICVIKRQARHFIQEGKWRGACPVGASGWAGRRKSLWRLPQQYLGLRHNRSCSRPGDRLNSYGRLNWGLMIMRLPFGCSHCLSGVFSGPWRERGWRRRGDRCRRCGNRGYRQPAYRRGDDPLAFSRREGWSVFSSGPRCGAQKPLRHGPVFGREDFARRRTRRRQGC